MQAVLKKAIKETLQELGFPGVDFVLEHPADMTHGDWASNVGLIVRKQVKENPSTIAEKITAQLVQKHIAGVEKIEVAGPGFINVTLKRDVFIEGLANALQEEWGDTDLYKGKKILVEHSSPNLFKPFHIGHLMNNTIGEAITRLAKVSGAEVTTLSFPSDISLGVAKAIFVLLEKYGEDFKLGDVTVLGDAYVEGVKRYDEDESVHVRVKEIADNLYAHNDTPEVRLFEKCKTFNIAYFESVVSRLGSHFDGYIYESEAGVVGKEIVEKQTPAVFTKSEGAVVYIPQEEGKLHTAVFLNSQGNPTYEAKDLGLLELKFERYDPDLSIFITDGQQVSHFEVVLDAARRINKEWAEKSLHRYHGRMSFKGQKMSSRLGGVPLVEDILASVSDEVKIKNPDIQKETSEMVAIGALKFAILKAKAGMNINFDPETSLSFVGDSGPYLQYSVVRAQSLITKAGMADILPDISSPITGTETLEKMIARFPEVVLQAQSEWAPHYLITYMTELAQYFNSWYGQGKIIDEDKQASAYRISVVCAVRNTLAKGLSLVGIEVPEKM